MAKKTSGNKNQNALWAGRFVASPHEALMRFTGSLETDRRMAVEDIEGSKAHADMLAQTGLLGAKDAATISRGLAQLLKDARAGRFEFAPQDEDIHLYHERRLVALVGEAGKRLHTARSRNDQVATDARLYARRRLSEIRALLLDLLGVLSHQAQAHADVPFMGFTHLQAAMPISAGHWFMAYFWMLHRDLDLLDHALKTTNAACPLGSGALAGTGLPINRHATAAALGFDAPHPNSLDAVADRDFMAQGLFALSMLGLHLSRMAEDMVLYASAEFGLLLLPDDFATGSSMMPQKKNPDVAELARAKAGLLLGDLLSLLTLLKNLPTAYNRDLQEDKPVFFRGLDTAQGLLEVWVPFVSAVGLKPYPFAEKDPLGLTAATDLAEFLVSGGLPFREAHEIAGGLVKAALKQQKPLGEIAPAALHQQHPALLNTPAKVRELKNALDPRQSMNRKHSLGGGSPKSVRAQVRQAQKILSQAEKNHVS